MRSPFALIEQSEMPDPGCLQFVDTNRYARRMGTTTTIRVDTKTHAQLLAMSESAGTSLVDTVRAAAEALRRQRFGHQVAGEVDALRRDPKAWAAYLAAAEETIVPDGVD